MNLDNDENEKEISEEISEYNPYSDMSSFQSENDEGIEMDIPISEDDNYEQEEKNYKDEIIDEKNVDESDSDDDNFENPSFIDYENNEDDNKNYNEQESNIQQEETQIIDNQESSLSQSQDDFDDEEGKIENFYERKISPEQAAKAKSSEPKQINKRLLSIIIVVVIGGVLLITFLMPTKTKKGSGENSKKIASKNNLANYEALANKQLKDYEPYQKNNKINNTESTIPNSTGFIQTEYDENGEVIIPPVIKEEKKAYNPNTTYSSGGGGSSTTIEIPDTRNDTLHEKTISGIKGLTSSQQRYSTDYTQQVEKNVASTTRNNYTLPSKDEYMSSMLNAYTSAYGNTQNPYATQNDQSGKNSFYNNGKNEENVGQGEWLDLNTIWQGTIIEATLTSELNTDLPGEITARVAKNVYSSQDGRFLLIPQNSVLYGSYNSSISYAQKRVQVGWHTLIRPDGYQINLGNMNATDAKGASGLKGFVNDHPFAYLKAIGLMSVFSIINSEFQNSMGDTNNEYVQNVMANTQQVTNELGEKLIDRAMNVQPTIKIKSGTKINIVASQNLQLPPCEEIPVTEHYRKY